jgi:hypothetical protein
MYNVTIHVRETVGAYACRLELSATTDDGKTHHLASRDALVAEVASEGDDVVDCLLAAARFVRICLR